MFKTTRDTIIKQEVKRKNPRNKVLIIVDKIIDRYGRFKSNERGIVDGY